MENRYLNHSLSGCVLDLEGRPVPGVQIYWVDPRYRTEERIELVHAHARGSTDDDGRFWAVDLPPGPALLVPDLFGVAIDGESIRIAHGTPVSVPSAEKVVVAFPWTPLDFARLKGSVTGPDGKPIGGRSVGLLGPEDPPAVRCQALTDEAGKFEMRGLRPGPARVLVFGDRTLSDGIGLLELEGGKTTDMTVQMPVRPKGPRYSARVCCIDELGLPVAGAQVRLGLLNTDLDPITVDESGVAVFSDLPVRPATAIAVARGHLFGSAPPPLGEDLDVEIGVEIRRAAIVRLRVLDAGTGAPLPHPGIRLGREGYEAGNRGMVPPPGTREPGTYSFPLPAGPLALRVDVPGYEPEECVVDVPAPPAELPPVVLKMRRRS